MSGSLNFATIRELAAMLRRRETSPTELTRLSLDRLASVGSRLNAVVTLTEERALLDARQAEAELAAGTDRGLLHGIPYGIKDLLAAEGYPTTWGATTYREQVFDYDATVVRRLHHAGAVLVAKLAMTELAGAMGDRQPNNTFTGPCRTPWSERHWSGGSSSGSAAAVASGCVPFAIGSETGGSIVIPSAFCGVSGIRPTFGRVSRHGSMVASWTLDKLGPICRSVDDCGLVLSAIAGHDPHDPTSTPRPYSYPAQSSRQRGFRFGVVTQGIDEIEPAVRQNFEASLEVLEKIGTLEPVDLPAFPFDDLIGILKDGELASSFYDLLTSGEVRHLTTSEGRVNGLSSLGQPAHVYLHASRVRRQACIALDQTMVPYDALLAPTVKTVASQIDRHYSAGSILLPHVSSGNVTGTPAIAIPNGFDDNDLPTSLCFFGRAYDETVLIEAAAAYQSRTDWHRNMPPVS